MARTTGVVLTRSERIPPRPTGRTAFAVAGLVALAHLGLLASAALGAPVVFAVLAVACTALEPVAERVVPLLPWALTRSLLTLPWRWAVTVAALLCLMVVRPSPNGVLAGAVLVAGVVLGLSAALVEGFAEVVGHLRKSPVLTRNLPVPGPVAAPAPPLAAAPARPGADARRTCCWCARRPWPCRAPSRSAWSPRCWRCRCCWPSAWRWPPRGWCWPPAATTPAPPCPPAVQAEVTRLAPELVLYYGGGPDALYQVEMWLPTLEAEPPPHAGRAARPRVAAADGPRPGCRSCACRPAPC